MQTISLRNPAGHAIEIRRGPGRRILVRHAHLDSEEFGNFRDPDALARMFQRHGLGSDPELGTALRELERECGARLELKRVTHRLNPVDATLIRAAIGDV